MTDDGKYISDVVFVGFPSEQVIEARKIFGLRKNDRFTRTRALHARDRMSRVESLRDLEYDVHPDQSDPTNKLIITITLIQKNHQEQGTIPGDQFKLPDEKK